MRARPATQLPSIRLADAQVSILFACRLIGMRVGDTDYGRSLKVHCPFGELYHTDLGADRAMRIYPDTNTAWCFACSAGYTPVRLVATAWGMPQADAALLLLDEAGLRLPSPAQAWARAVNPPEPAPQVSHLAEALKTFCARIDAAWSWRQFEPQAAARLTACLGLLDRVHTADDARQWLAGCKVVMTRALRGPETTPSVHSE